MAQPQLFCWSHGKRYAQLSPHPQMESPHHRRKADLVGHNFLLVNPWWLLLFTHHGKSMVAILHAWNFYVSGLHKWTLTQFCSTVGSISCLQTFILSTDLDSKGQGKDFPFYLGSLLNFASGQCPPWCSFQCISRSSSYYLHILHQFQYLLSYELSIIHTAYPVNASTFLQG